MILFFRPISAVGCAAVCLLAGCSLTPKHHAQCGTCVPPLAALPASTYENYTPPPVVKPLPASEGIAPPPPETSLNAGSPRASAQAGSDSVYDFFESSREQQTN